MGNYMKEDTHIMITFNGRNEFAERPNTYADIASTLIKHGLANRYADHADNEIFLVWAKEEEAWKLIDERDGEEGRAQLEGCE